MSLITKAMSFGFKFGVVHKGKDGVPKICASPCYCFTKQGIEDNTSSASLLTEFSGPHLQEGTSKHHFEILIVNVSGYTFTLCCNK